MKYSTVTPVQKKGVFTDPSNRPISVVTSFAKVLEMALYERMVEYISYNSIMTDQQFGFRKGYSTDEAIFKLVYEVLNALNDKSKVGSIFLDLEKAFDSVNHSLLIKKLSCYGINRKAKQLIESYLSNRYQQVILKKNSRTNSNVVSEWESIKHGVPQGSVLGPLLFLQSAHVLLSTELQNKKWPFLTQHPIRLSRCYFPESGSHVPLAKTKPAKQSIYTYQH